MSHRAAEPSGARPPRPAARAGEAPATRPAPPMRVVTKGWWRSSETRVSAEELRRDGREHRDD